MTFPGNPMPYAPPAQQHGYAVPPNGVYPPFGAYAQPAPGKKKPNTGLMVVAVAGLAALAFVMFNGSSSEVDEQVARYERSAVQETADGDDIGARYYTELAACARAHGASGPDMDACGANAAERMRKACAAKGDAERAAERARIKSKYGG